MKKIILMLCFTIISSAQVEIVENFTIFGSIVNNKTIFTRTTPEYGKEVWVSDGTPGNAQLLKDIVPGPAGSEPQLGFDLINNVVYFKANNGQIWRTDGTSNGTYAMENNNLIINPSEFIGVGQFIFFRDQGNLWKMQSTPNSESLVTTVQTLNFSEINGLVKLDDNEILFNGKLLLGGKWGIYRSNGLRIELVRDINTATHPNVSSSSNLEYVQMSQPKNIGGTIYFIGYSSEFQGELWKTNGTFPKTVIVKDIFENNSNPFRNATILKIFNRVDGNVYFSANDGLNGTQLWKTNESTGNTKMVKDIDTVKNTDSFPDSFTEVGSNIYFVQNTSNNSSDIQIWKTNGTASGTIQITTLPTGYLQLTELFYKNNFIYFSLFTPASGTELWKLNTIDDTYSLIADIAPGTLSSGPSGFFELNNYIYFNASSNGTLGGTKAYRVADQNLANPNVRNSAKLKIHPNPTSKILNIEIDNNSNFEVEIYDLIGKKVAQYSNQKQLDISELNSGTYLVKIKDVVTQKIIATKIKKE